MIGTLKSGITKLCQKATIALLVTALCAVHSEVSFARQKFAAVTIDARNGAMLFNDDADGQRYPASLTKVMTLYILFQDLKAGRIKMSTPLRVSRRAASMPPSKLGLKPGSTISVELAIKALVIQSANDVASVVAENLGGTESNFGARMTRVARSLGMNRSTYHNASGLPNARQVTTARDQATLALRVMRDFPQYYPYFRLGAFTYRGRTIRSHNRLVGNFAGTDGIKTGYTNAAGYNLTTSTKRGDKRLVGVVLGAKSSSRRSVYMMKMLDRAFAKAKSGNTVAARAGTSAGAVDPLQNLKIAKADTSKLAEQAQQASVDPASAQEQTASTTPEIGAAVGVDANEVVTSWNIQVGTYPDKQAARDKILNLQASGLKPLRGKTAFTMAVQKGEEIVYRARFAGFTQSSAAAACKAVVTKGVDCLPVQPQS